MLYSCTVGHNGRLGVRQRVTVRNEVRIYFYIQIQTDCWLYVTIDLVTQYSHMSVSINVRGCVP